MSRFPFRFVDGAIHLPSAGLWLDAHRSVVGEQRVVVSHAHSDHTGAHREVILTEATARLMRSRMGRGRQVEHHLSFGERRGFAWEGRDCFVTLLPAGHILGSSMALVEWDGRRLLYTGDFQIRCGGSAEPCDLEQLAGLGPVDYLVMETTFGRPLYRFPPAAEVRRDLVRFCRETLAAGGVPALLGYSLGKSQELLHMLAGEGFEIMLHETVERLTKVHEQLGCRFPEYRTLDTASARGKVVICPPSAIRADWAAGVEGLRTALATGWAMESSCKYRSRVDAAFPLSDHADFDDLLAFVQRLAPRQVFTLHGFAGDFAATLRALGFDARALGCEEQLALPLWQVRAGPSFGAQGT